MADLFNFACTANFGRSVPAALVGYDYLLKSGLEQEYSTISSGTSVNDILAGRNPKPVMERFVEMAVKRGDVYSSSQLKELDRAVRERDDRAFARLYKIVEAQFHHDEAENRQVVLPEFGLSPDRLKCSQDQLTPLDDVVAIFPLAEGNYRQAVAIHEKAGYTPSSKRSPIGTIMEKGGHAVLIAVLAAYARDNPHAQTPDAFGKPREAYRETIVSIVTDVPLAIERFHSKR